MLIAAPLSIFAFSSSYYSGPPSDHFDGRHFFDPLSKKPLSPLSIIRWWLTSDKALWPKWVENTFSDSPPPAVYGSELRVSFVNHSSVLLQTAGKNILVDPVWSDRVGPFSLIGPKRVHAPGIAFDNLPKIDIVLITHAHYDHLDLNTIERLWLRDHPRFFSGLGTDQIVKKASSDIAVQAMDWHQSCILGNQLILHFVPTQHWSARSPWDRNSSLWGAFVLQTGSEAIYVGGDTGYGNGTYFRKAAEKFGRFRLSLLPIGAYEPRWFMQFGHLNPEEAVLAHLALRTTQSIAIHWGTFQLSDEARDAPKKELEAALNQHRVAKSQFRTLEPGEALLIP